MPDQYNECDKENIVSQLLKVQAQIEVTPLVKHGTPTVRCIKSCIKPNPVRCDHECYDCDCYNRNDCDGFDRYSDYGTAREPEREECNCNFTLTQVVCIEVPISIDADVNIKEGVASCGRPTVRSTDEVDKKKQFYMQMI